MGDFYSSFFNIPLYQIICTVIIIIAVVLACICFHDGDVKEGLWILFSAVLLIVIIPILIMAFAIVIIVVILIAVFCFNDD